MDTAHQPVLMAKASSCLHKPLGRFVALSVGQYQDSRTELVVACQGAEEGQATMGRQSDLLKTSLSAIKGQLKLTEHVGEQHK